MKHLPKLVAVAALGALFSVPAARATNPLIMDQFTADPTARVFEGRVYVYPSHDIREPSYYTGGMNWLVMVDYDVFSSAHLTDWTDDGGILLRKDFPSADPAASVLCAPDWVLK